MLSSIAAAQSPWRQRLFFLFHTYHFDVCDSKSNEKTLKLFFDSGNPGNARKFMHAKIYHGVEGCARKSIASFRSYGLSDRRDHHRENYSNGRPDRPVPGHSLSDQLLRWIWSCERLLNSRSLTISKNTYQISDFPSLKFRARTSVSNKVKHFLTSCIWDYNRQRSRNSKSENREFALYVHFGRITSDKYS